MSDSDCQGEGPEFVERAEIQRLTSELREAREIIGESLQVLDMLSNEFFPEIASFVETVGLHDHAERIRKVMPRADGDLPTRARSFLEKADG